MDVNHLRSRELSYELRIRGIEDMGDVNDKRRMLRGLWAQEKKGIGLVQIIRAFSFDVDLTEASETVNNLGEIVSTFSGDTNESVYGRLMSRLVHVTQRLERLEVETEDQRKQKMALYGRILFLEGEIAEKVENREDIATNVSRQSSTRPQTTGQSITLPPYKWNVQFSGSSSCESINAFLEKIELLREARQVSKDVLFSSACDLFTGPAWTWYVTNRSKVKNWDELVDKLREDFLPYHYEQDLLREIDQRTQGQQERVTFFISSMENLFNRLKNKPDEQVMVDKIRQNLLPSYIDRLALSSPSTVSELTQLCKRLEESDAWSVRYKPPPSRKSGLLEPDLSYLFNEMNIPRSKSGLSMSFKKVSNTSTLECWNCRAPGHRYTDCSIARRFFCYGCGEANVSKTNCQKCQAKNAKETGGVSPDNFPSTSRPSNKHVTNTGIKPKTKSNSSRKNDST